MTRSRRTDGPAAHHTQWRDQGGLTAAPDASISGHRVVRDDIAMPTVSSGSRTAPAILRSPGPGDTANGRACLLSPVLDSNSRATLDVLTRRLAFSITDFEFNPIATADRSGTGAPTVN